MRKDLEVRRWRRAALVAMAIGAMAGCAPRMVTKITGTDTQLKLIYARQQAFDSETGVIQCQREEDGSLTNCSELEINFNDGGK